MKRGFFVALQNVIFAPDFQNLKARFQNLHDDFLSHKVIFDEQDFVARSAEVAAHFLDSNLPQNSVKSAMKIRRVNKVKSQVGGAKILHSVAHIEFCAVLLALDAVYRFGAQFLNSGRLDSENLSGARLDFQNLDSEISESKNLAREFCADWLEVAAEEISHFEKLDSVLRELGFKYGDFPVHRGLFDALILSEQNLALRMGVVHRGLEAKGLDANIFVRQKLQDCEFHNLGVQKPIVQAFDVILKDEISHVSKGDKWFKFQALDSQKQFLDICKDFKDRFYLAGKVLNRPARLQAGFSESELNELENLYKKE